jgi:magnesium-transporting ATPase (P-type)
VVDAKDPETYKTEDGAPSATGLVFLGLISLVDPPRPGVLEAVHKARAAGASHIGNCSHAVIAVWYCCS